MNNDNLAMNKRFT